MEFVLSFKPHDEKGYLISAQLGDERAKGSFTSPIDSETLNALFRHIETAETSEDWELANKSLIGAGIKLFESLFTKNSDIYELFKDTKTQTPIILQFEEDTEKLLPLPWEYMTEPEERTHLATLYPLIRSLGSIQTFDSDTEKPPSALIVISEPLELHRFGARKVYDDLLKILTPLADDGVLDIDFLPPPSTSEAFAQAMSEKSSDIVHFVGHGHQATLAFEGKHGEKEIIPADKLRMIFTDSGVKLVFLTACLSGATQGDLLAGTATSILKAGIPAVIAMQFSALVKPANSFAYDVYKAIRKAPLKQAVAQARKKCCFTGQGVEAFQWGVPVFYQQPIETELFTEVTSSGETTQIGAWPETAALYTQKGKRFPKKDPDFVGRGGKMVEINEALEDSTIVTLLGLGGIGKTALATEHAWYLHERNLYPGGIIWSDFEGGGSLEQILEIFTHLFGKQFMQLPLDKRKKLALDQLKNEETLLVLDNFEPMLNPDEEAPTAEKKHQGQIDEIAKFLRDVPEPSNILITSREKVGVDEKVVPLDKLEPDEGIRFFLEKARKCGAKIKPGPELSQQDKESIERIHETLDGFPLAIELAATHAASMPLNTLKDKLDKELMNVLKAERPGLDKRLKSVEASLELSYKTLSPEAKKLFPRLFVFVGGARGYAISDVCNLENWKKPMEELVNKSLVDFDQDHGIWQLHPVIREYAQTKLDPKERATYLKNHAQFFLKLAVTMSVEYSKEKDASALRVIDVEFDNIKASLNWCEKSKNWEDIIQYLEALDDYLILRGLWTDLLNYLETGREACQKVGNKMKEVMFLGNIGNTNYRLGNSRKAKSVYQKVLEKVDQIGKNNVVSSAQLQRFKIAIYHQLGMIQENQGNYREAEDLYNQSLKIKEEVRDKSGVAISLHQLGMIQQKQGNYQEAEKLYNQSLDIAEEIGNRSGAADTLHQLGMIQQKQGNYQKAEKLYNQSLEIREEIGNKSGIANSLHQRGMIQEDQGNYQEAEKLYNQSLEITREIGDKSLIAISLAQLGSLAFKAENYKEALKYYLVSFNIFEKLKSPNKEIVELSIADLHEEVGSEKYTELLEEVKESVEAELKEIFES